MIWSSRRGSEEVPPDLLIRIMRIRIATETGWTLEYIDNLGLNDVGDIFAYMNAKSQLENG